jgi:hypothetical protein
MHDYSFDTRKKIWNENFAKKFRTCRLPFPETWSLINSLLLVIICNRGPVYPIGNGNKRGKFSGYRRTIENIWLKCQRVFRKLDRFRKDDATSKTTWMSSFGANYRQLLVCHVVLDDFTTQKYNFHVLSRTSQILSFFWKNYESMHDENRPILFLMYCLMILVKGFSLTRLFFLYFAKFWTC